MILQQNVMKAPSLYPKKTSGPSHPGHTPHVTLPLPTIPRVLLNHRNVSSQHRYIQTVSFFFKFTNMFTMKFNLKNNVPGRMWWHVFLIPVHRWQRQAGPSEFEVGLVYKASSDHPRLTW